MFNGARDGEGEDGHQWMVRERVAWEDGLCERFEQAWHVCSCTTMNLSLQTEGK